MECGRQFDGSRGTRFGRRVLGDRRTRRGWRSSSGSSLTILGAVYNLLRPHMGLGGLTPFQASGGGGPTWHTLAKAL